jgi:hypothetical protein
VTAALIAELDRWAAAGRVASFWWRDDDAVAATPALDRLLALAAGHRVPLALAVIPGALEPSLTERLTGAVAVLQHGWRHTNHAPPERKKAELGAERPAVETAADLAVGQARLYAAFGPRFLPVLVPPWNRIAPDVVALLPALGFTGLSTAKPRPAPWAAPGVLHVNSHVDPIAWRHGKRALPWDELSALVTDQLATRRAGRTDTNEPIGLLTHHLVHDETLWQCLERLLAATRAHRAARWLSGEEVFARP